MGLFKPTPSGSLGSDVARGQYGDWNAGSGSTPDGGTDLLSQNPAGNADIMSDPTLGSTPSGVTNLAETGGTQATSGAFGGADTLGSLGGTAAADTAGTSAAEAAGADALGTAAADAGATAAAETAGTAAAESALTTAGAANSWNPLGWGMLAAGALLASQEAADGGLIQKGLRGRVEPGKRKNLKQGGPVRGPGTPTSDSIPAWLSDKEYVLNAEATRMVGKKKLDAINQRGLAARAKRQARPSAPSAPAAYRNGGFSGGAPLLRRPPPQIAQPMSTMYATPGAPKAPVAARPVALPTARVPRFGMGGFLHDANGGAGTLTMNLLGEPTDNLDDAQKAASILGDPIGTEYFRCGGLARRGG
jgi:hypothetical protein